MNERPTTARTTKDWNDEELGRRTNWNDRCAGTTDVVPPERNNDGRRETDVVGWLKLRGERETRETERRERGEREA